VTRGQRLPLISPTSGDIVPRNDVTNELGPRPFKPAGPNPINDSSRVINPASIQSYLAIESRMTVPRASISPMTTPNYHVVQLVAPNVDIVISRFGITGVTSWH
jgi:hypothetical protein